MDRRNISILIGILLLTGLCIWIVTSNVEYTFPAGADGTTTQETMPFWAALLPWQGNQQRSIKVHQGLDLQGGLQVVLEADLPEGQELGEGSMEAARIIVDNRVNGLGVTEPLVQLQGENRIIVELPGISDPDLAISTINETGLLEFVDAGSTPMPDGTIIKTTFGGDSASPGDTAEGQADVPETVYETIITGGDLEQVSNAGFNPDSRVVEINFSLNPKAATNLAITPAPTSAISSVLCWIKTLSPAPASTPELPITAPSRWGRQPGTRSGAGHSVTLRCLAGTAQSC